MLAHNEKLKEENHEGIHVIQNLLNHWKTSCSMKIQNYVGNTLMELQMKATIAIKC